MRYFRLTQSHEVLHGWVITGILFRPGLANRLYFALGTDRGHAIRQIDFQLERDGIAAHQILY